MLNMRRSGDRGETRLDWLDSRHTFSFGGYHDPAHMGFGPLRVINEDRVVAGAGFPTHAHRDMEILTWVLDGALAHRDSLGNGSVIGPGELQRMSAGAGIRHSEYNASADEPVHFLQIWILPDRTGLPPGYEQAAFADDELDGRLRLLASPDGRDGSITVHQDVRVLAGRIHAGESVTHRLASGRRAWLQVTRGTVRVEGERLQAGDGAALARPETLPETLPKTLPETLVVAADDDADVLLFDLP